MGFFSSIGHAIGGIFGGGGSKSSTNTSSITKTTVNPVTNVTNKIDLEPVAEILAKSNVQSTKIYAQSAKAQTDAQKIALINAERERHLEVTKLNKFDTYLEHGKNGLILSGIAIAALYVYKKPKRR